MLKESDGDEYFRKVVPSAIAAWNASFLTTEKQQTMIQDMIGLLSIHDQNAQVFRKEIENLIDCKFSEFSDIDTLIVNYTITPSERGLQLFVASTLPDSRGTSNDQGSPLPTKTI